MKIYGAGFYCHCHILMAAFTDYAQETPKWAFFNFVTPPLPPQCSEQPWKQLPPRPACWETPQLCRFLFRCPSVPPFSCLLSKLQWNTQQSSWWRTDKGGSQGHCGHSRGLCHSRSPQFPAGGPVLLLSSGRTGDVPRKSKGSWDRRRSSPFPTTRLLPYN